MKKGDIVLMIILGVAAAFILAGIVFKPKALNCVVYEDQNRIASFPMKEDITYAIITSYGHTNVLRIENGKADVMEADCPNQICVHTAPISRVGDTILCLPHKVSVVLESP